MANKSKISSLQKAYSKCNKLENELVCALQHLSTIASDLYGEVLTAELTGDGEIEFRLNDEFEMSDPNTCIRIEEIIDKATYEP